VYHLVYAYLVLISLFFCVQVIHQVISKLRKTRLERSMEVPDYEYDDMEILVLPLLGKNIHWDPWHLEVDISKEFKSFVPRSEIIGLIRVSTAIISRINPFRRSTLL
jgi:hypothetical protein